MIAHECPCKTFGACFRQETRQALHEIQPVFILQIDVPAFHTPHHDMMERPRCINAGSAWHDSPYLVSPGLSIEIFKVVPFRPEDALHPLGHFLDIQLFLQGQFCTGMPIADKLLTR